MEHAVTSDVRRRSRVSFAGGFGMLALFTLGVMGPCLDENATSTRPPPAGVILIEIDGGVDYFGRWPGTFPPAQEFFPIAVWGETFAEPGSISRYRSLGINTAVALWPGAAYDVADELARYGMYLIDGVPTDGSTSGPSHVGWSITDEPDGRYVCDELEAVWLREVCFGDPTSHTDADAVAALADEVRRRDPSRLVYQQFTKPVARPGHHSPHDRRGLVAMVRSGDIVSFDYYPLADPWDPGEVWDLHTSTRHVRSLAGFDRPVWVFIETSRIFAENGPDHPEPSIAEIRAEVWHALIGGARGIQYFNHNFSSGDPSRPPTQHLLIDPAYRDIAAGVRDLNAEVKGMTRALAAPYAWGAVRTYGAANVSTRYVDGGYTVFAATRSPRDQTITFDVAGATNGSVEVIGENRRLELRDGRFTDRFAGDVGVHLYRLDLG